MLFVLVSESDLRLALLVNTDVKEMPSPRPTPVTSSSLPFPAPHILQFRNPDPNGVFANSNSWEIVEDTEEAFEIRITGCLDAEVFLERDAGALGFATVCHAKGSYPHRQLAPFKHS